MPDTVSVASVGVGSPGAARAGGSRRGQGTGELAAAVQQQRQWVRWYDIRMANGYGGVMGMARLGWALVLCGTHTQQTHTHMVLCGTHTRPYPI